VKSEMLAVFREHRHPDALFTAVNERLAATAQLRHVTALLVILDGASRQMRYVNAGHPGVISSDGTVWESTGPPLGMLEGARYEVREAVLKPGERLLLFTDGIAEAMKPDGAEFGVDRIRDEFMAGAQLSRAAALDRITGAALAFTGAPAFADDATAILLEVGR